MKETHERSEINDLSSLKLKTGLISKAINRLFDFQVLLCRQRRPVSDCSMRLLPPLTPTCQGSEKQCDIRDDQVALDQHISFCLALNSQ